MTRRITALRGTSGPGIESLEYLGPRDGRPFPANENPHAVVHRQTVLITNGADDAAHNLITAQVNFVSSGVVVNEIDQLGFRKAFEVRDADGHAIEIEENKEEQVRRGTIQNAIENKSMIMGAGLLDFSHPEVKFESEQPTLADLMVPGRGRSISAELECLLRLLIANGERS